MGKPPYPIVNRYRLFQRSSGVFYIQDNQTNRQESLRTKDQKEAERLVFHRNESERVPGANRQIAIGYLIAADPEIQTRTWSTVMEEFCRMDVEESTRKRKERAMKDKALKRLARMRLLETRPEHFFNALRSGTVSTNCFLRKLHNLARRLKWLPDDILVTGTWPVIRHAEKRAITYSEHGRILEATPTEERKHYYEVLWHTGASQSDVAKMTAEAINWQEGVIRFSRQKVKHRGQGDVTLVMGPTLESILEALPKNGQLFPTLAAVGENDRATRFKRQCEQLGIEGITLHSYRYAVIQRAKKCGYNKRYAMAMVGHSRETTHDDYAAGGAITIPSLEECELAYATLEDQRLKIREERRSNVIQMRGHLLEAKSV